jgi:CRISPR-associated protein Cas1
MAFVYVTEQGAVVKKAGERLVVAKDEKNLLDIPASKVEGVLIFGNVQFTTQAVHLMFEQGIELALFTRRGRFLGRLSSPVTKNITLRQRQYERHADTTFALSTAKSILTGKLTNAVQLMREYGHNHPEVDFGADVSRLSELLDNVQVQRDLESLLGIEGSAAHIYFAVLGRMIRRTFEFNGRRKRPAPDPVNALLSLGYTLVYNEIESLLDGMGFDPYLGFYHQPRYGHATLASDLMEEFRAPVVDRLTLYVVNNNILKEEDFFLHKPMGGMYLKDDARKRYFGEYERFVTRTMGPPEEGNEVTYRSLFLRQAGRFRQAVMESADYEPYLFRW